MTSVAHHRRGARLDAATVKTRISPLDFYRAELPGMPTPRGTKWVDAGLCPFHADRHAGSFKVHARTGAFRCFSCGAHGQDVIAFVMLRYNTNFLDALARLAHTWGITP